MRTGYQKIISLYAIYIYIYIICLNENKISKDYFSLCYIYILFV